MSNAITPAPQSEPAKVAALAVAKARLRRQRRASFFQSVREFNAAAELAMAEAASSTAKIQWEAGK